MYIVCANLNEGSLFKQVTNLTTDTVHKERKWHPLGKFRFYFKKSRGLSWFDANSKDFFY